MAPREKHYINDGIRLGFSILTGSDSDIPSYEVANYASATQPGAKEKLNSLFMNELSCDRIAPSLTKPHCVHAIGAVAKKDSDDLRPITDASRGESQGAINDFISYPSMRYKTIDNATALMTVGCYMCIVDISKAYRHVPIRPNQRKFQGFKWNFDAHGKEEYYVDQFLCFGMSSAPGIFTRISNAITSMMKHLGFKAVVNFIDDFWLCAATYEDCLAAQHAIIRLLRELGFGISWPKLIGPSQCVRFLGIDLNSITMEALLPDDKLFKLSQTLETFKGRKKASKKSLQQLTGLLNHASSVLKGGRTFTRRIIDAMNSVRCGNHFVRLNTCFQKDINWWCNTARWFNGKQKIINPVPLELSTFQSDSSFSGFGIYFKGDYLFGSWDSATTLYAPAVAIQCHRAHFDIPDSLRQNINYLELYPALFAARKWGSFWRDCHIVLRTDNTSVVCFINTGTCRNSEAMDVLRELFWLSVEYNFHLTARHLKGSLQHICDKLSRLAEGGHIWSALMDYVSTNNVSFCFCSQEHSDQNCRRSF